MTGLRPDGGEMAEAITVALDEARLDPEAVDYVNAHGSGTKQNDRHETAAFKKSLGEHAYDIPVSSIKSMVGHSLGAIGSIEVAAWALAMERGVVPPTANLKTRDPVCDLDYVPVTAREHGMDAVLTVGSGFGGFQSAMVLARPGTAEARRGPEEGSEHDRAGRTRGDGARHRRAQRPRRGRTGRRCWPASAASAASAASTRRRTRCGCAGEVPGFDAAGHVPSRLLAQTDHWTTSRWARARAPWPTPAPTSRPTPRTRWAW
ncbi:hypothetical protein SHIRM173S_05807 [Streptomyces hirsutus]